MSDTTTERAVNRDAMKVSDEVAIPDHRYEQVVRNVPRSARHQPHGEPRRTHRGMWPVRFGQIDADPLH